MSTKKILIEEIESMTERELKQILTIVKQIKSESNYLDEKLKSPSLITINSEEERKKFIHSLRGKYAHINTSSEDFAQRKQAEIDWENRIK